MEKQELKTFRDFLDDESFYINYKDVRQEAIKWVKILEKNTPIPDDPYKTVPKWIKHFFNITEEELKE